MGVTVNDCHELMKILLHTVGFLNKDGKFLIEIQFTIKLQECFCKYFITV